MARKKAHTPVIPDEMLDQRRKALAERPLNDEMDHPLGGKVKQPPNSALIQCFVA
jgi:hypothetical protein